MDWLFRNLGRLLGLGRWRLGLRGGCRGGRLGFSVVSGELGVGSGWEGEEGRGRTWCKS